MTDSAKPSENGKPNLPPGVAQTAAEEYQRDAAIVQEMSAAGALSVIIGKKLQNAVRPAGFKVYRDELLKASGDPSDPLECMLLEQAMVAHHRIFDLHARASTAETPEMMEILCAAATKLTAEFRRLSLAVREYRAPVTPKNVTLVRQQNLSAGDQQIALIEKRPSVPMQNIETATDSTNQNKALTHEISQTFDSQVPGRNRAPIKSV